MAAPVRPSRSTTAPQAPVRAAQAAPAASGRPAASAPAARPGGDQMSFSAGGLSLRERALQQAREEAKLLDAFDDAARQVAMGSPEALAASLPDLGSSVPSRRSTSPFALQSVRVADRNRSGAETRLEFEQMNGELMDTPNGLFQPVTDPHTGRTDVALREARLRLTANGYDLYVKVDADGGVRFDSLRQGGRKVESLLGDSIQERIDANPAVWGSAAVMTVAAAAVAGNQYVARTGRRIDFNLGRATLAEGENWDVKAKLRGELTGKSTVLGAAGGEIAATYRAENRGEAKAGLRYDRHEDDVRLVTEYHYPLTEALQLDAGASVGKGGNLQAGISISGKF